MKKTEKPIFMEETTEETLLCGYTDENDVVHKTFSIRPITGMDEEVIAKPEFKQNGAKSINEILTRCVLSIGTLTPADMGKEAWRKVIKSLYVGDQDYMIMKLRAISSGNDIVFTTKCNDCGKTNETHVTVEEIEVQEFKGEVEIPFELPYGVRDKSGELHREGKLRLPTGMDRELTAPTAQTNISRGTSLLLSRLMTFNDEYPVTILLTSGLILKDRDYLGVLLNENIFGVKTEVSIVCATCGSEYTGKMESINFM